MQLDSHTRVKANWDIELIKMLHSCDAGEYSVLTGYVAPFWDEGILNEIEVRNEKILAMRWNGPLPSKVVLCGSSKIEKNVDWFVKPFESGCFAGCFVFSHGHFILNAGYSKDFSNIFQWEEPF